MNKLCFRFYFRSTTVYIAIVMCVLRPLRSFLEGHRALAIDINLINYSERENVYIFILFFFMETCVDYALAILALLSVTCFVLFSSYIISELELISYYIQGLPLDNVRNIANHLSEITELHLEVLK